MALFALSKDLRTVQQAPGTFEDVKDIQDLFDEIKARINGNMQGVDLLAAGVTSREIQAASVLKDDLDADTARRLGVQRTGAGQRKQKAELTNVAIAGSGVLTDLASLTFTQEHTYELLLLAASMGNVSVTQSYGIRLEVNGVNVNAPYGTSISTGATNFANLYSSASFSQGNDQDSSRLLALPLKASPGGSGIAPPLGNNFAVKFRAITNIGAATVGTVRLYAQLLGFS